MNIRTDLITEIKTEQKHNVNGMLIKNKKIGQVKISTITIKTDTAAKSLNKPKGQYCTIYFPRLDFICDTQNVIDALRNALKTILPRPLDNVLVVGLGNRDITPDALGPLVADRIFATRHLSNKLKRDLNLEQLNCVSVITPNVLGKTGIESYDMVCAAVDKIKPDAVIVIDALACRDAERLCRTIQIADSGITAGSGVNNTRKALSHDTVGVPVIALGVPTVIDANSFFETQEDMMVTPKEIDLLVEKAADIISSAVNIFLQPQIDVNVIESLT